MRNFIKSDYTIDDLQSFRDESGFIDLSKANIHLTKESRETKGTHFRIKNWVDFKGKKALIRGEVPKENSYCIYAEIIVEEIAKQVGIETAHYDLMKIKDEYGNTILGVLSEAIIDFDKEQLISLEDLIGPKLESPAGVTDYNFTVNILRERLQLSGWVDQDIEKIIQDYNKRLLFYLSVLDADKHPGNIGFIIGNNGTGKFPERIFKDLPEDKDTDFSEGGWVIKGTVFFSVYEGDDEWWQERFQEKFMMSLLPLMKNLVCFTQMMI